MPPNHSQQNTGSHPTPTRRKTTDKWKWAYYALALFNLVTIGAALLFSGSLSSQYNATIKTDDFWSTATSLLVDLNDTIVMANLPGNNVFDTLDPTLERYHKSQANDRFKRKLGELRAHLENAPNHLEQTAKIQQDLEQIENKFRILDARAQAIFDSIAMGQVDVAGSIMAIMDRTAGECSNLISETTNHVGRLQKEDFADGRNESERIAFLEALLFVAVALVVTISLIFGRRMFRFLDSQAAESEASRRRAEKARHELSSQTFALDQHSIVAITNTSGRIQYANDKFCQISKYTREELIGQDHRILNSGHHPRSFFAAMYKTIANGQVWQAEVKNKAKDGSYYWVDTNIVPYRDEDGRINSYVAIRTDITERKNAESKLAVALEEAKRASEEAEAANRAKSEFLATMSHEIRTPMNSVIGFSNLLLDSELPGNAQNFAKSILSSGQSLLAIINDILDFSKIEAGKLEIETMPFDLKQTAEEAVELLANQASQKNIELLLHYDSKLPRGFHSDPGRIRQIIINLTGNAVKFTENGHVYIEITPAPNAPESFVRIAIHDTGIGIPEKIQQRLFTKFTQADSSTSRNFGGTGLGLAICKLLAELLGGEIGLESEEGKGSTFWFTLPIPQTPVQLPEEQAPPDVSSHRILIVDDYPLNRQLLEQQCASWGLLTDCVANGEEALSCIKQARLEGNPYHVALLDYCMPQMDGFELGQKILQDPESKETKLIMITSGSGLSEATRFIDAGFHSYFLKPIIKPEELRIAIAHAIGIDYHYKSTLSRNNLATESSAPKGNFRVLIVDDTALNQTLLRSILEQKYNYRVDIAANGLEAIKQYQDFQYDAIFMDCMMPIMDGFEATQQIREIANARNEPHTPIVALTANALLGDEQKCYAAGMDDYLSKPINQNELIAILHRWLGDNPSVPSTSSQTPKEQTAPHDILLDLNRIEETFPNDPETQSLVLDAYLQSLDDLRERTQTYKSIDDLRLITHTLKGSSAECGAIPLHDIAKQIETACIQEESSKLPALLEKLTVVMARTREQVEDALLSLR